MQRYFFDVATASGTGYDFRGREFETVGHARQYAELIALDLAVVGDDHGSPGRTVKVRDLGGAMLLEVAVRYELQLVAA